MIPDKRDRAMLTDNLYRRHGVGPRELEPYYHRHLSAMTSEDLHSKSEIAEELAARDKRIAELELLASEAAKERELREATQEDVESLNGVVERQEKRIVELEDWQRRAVGTVAYARACDPNGPLGDICDQLIREATR